MLSGLALLFLLNKPKNPFPPELFFAELDVSGLTVLSADVPSVIAGISMLATGAGWGAMTGLLALLLFLALLPAFRAASS